MKHHRRCASPFPFWWTHACRRFLIKYFPERGRLGHMAQTARRDNVEAASMCQLLANLWPLLLGNVLAFWTARLDKRDGFICGVVSTWQIFMLVTVIGLWCDLPAKEWYDFGIYSCLASFENMVGKNIHIHFVAFVFRQWPDSTTFLWLHMIHMYSLLLPMSWRCPHRFWSSSGTKNIHPRNKTQFNQCS